MANLKEIRTRIASVTSTRQITSAMKMVAAAKLKKVQNTVINFRPYALKMRDIMENVVSSAGRDYESVYAAVRDYRQVLIVVITSNRGLCGAFNSNAIKEALQLAEKKYSNDFPQVKIRYMAIGKKGYDYLRKRTLPLDESNTEIIEHLTYDSAAAIAKSLMDAFISGQYDCIDIVYNEFINAASQRVVCKQFLPLLTEVQHPDKAKKTKNKKEHIDYLFEPSGEHVFCELIPKTLRLILYEVLLNSVSSECGARMTSMHQATDNATTLIQELTLQYNKARQAAITNEIVEIVGGAEALKG